MYPRWLKARGVSLPSEKRQRALSHEILGENLQSEAAPFSFPLKHGGEDLRPAPLVFVPDLPAMVFQHLEQNDRYTHANVYMYKYTVRKVHVYIYMYITCSVKRLTWHGIIPDDEVWVKVGGDKGSTTFKHTCVETCKTEYLSN